MTGRAAVVHPSLTPSVVWSSLPSSVPSALRPTSSPHLFPHSFTSGPKGLRLGETEEVKRGRGDTTPRMSEAAVSLAISVPCLSVRHSPSIRDERSEEGTA